MTQKVALFGAGRIGKLHAQHLAENEACQLAAIVDVHEPSAKALAQSYGAEPRSAEAVFADREIKADFLGRSTRQTPLAVVGIEAPKDFPLTFYREDPADRKLSLDEARKLPLEQVKILLLSGTALAHSPLREVSFDLAERAKKAGREVFMDLDFRPSEWHDLRAYGLAIRAILPLLDGVIATEEEAYAALFEPRLTLTKEERQRLDNYLEDTPVNVWVLKRGARGVKIYRSYQSSIELMGFKVDVVNTVGAGDAFASGFIYGYLQAWDLLQTARFANACGALLVSRQGCAAAMPRLEEVKTFLAERSGRM